MCLKLLWGSDKLVPPTISDASESVRLSLFLSVFRTECSYEYTSTSTERPAPSPWIMDPRKRDHQKDERELSLSVSRVYVSPGETPGAGMGDDSRCRGWKVTGWTGYMNISHARRTVSTVSQEFPCRLDQRARPDFAWPKEKEGEKDETSDRRPLFCAPGPPNATFLSTSPLNWASGRPSTLRVGCLNPYGRRI